VSGDPKIMEAFRTLGSAMDVEEDDARLKKIQARYNELVESYPSEASAYVDELDQAPSDGGVPDDGGTPVDEPADPPPPPATPAPQGGGFDPLQWLVNAGASMGPKGAPRAAARGTDAPLVGELDASQGFRKPAAPGQPVGVGEALAMGARDPVGISDEMMGEGAALAALLDLGRAQEPGDSARAMRDVELADQRNAAEQQPIPHAVGRAASATAIMAPTLVAGAPTAAGRAALGAAEGGALGAATGAASADDGDRVEGALIGGTGGAALGGLAPAMVALAGKGAPALERTASELRTAATGPYGAQLGRLAKDKGRDYVADVGRTIERRGVDQRGGLFSRAPMGPGGYAKRLDEVLPQVGREMDALLGEAEAVGADVPTVWLRAQVLRRAKDLESGASGTTDSGRAQAAKLREIASRLPDHETTPRLGPRELQALKEAWTGEVWKEANPQLARGGNTAEAFRAAAGVPRELLDEAIARKASPDLTERFKSLRDEYGHLRTAQDFAEGREFRETGNQLLSLPTTIAGAGGLAGGPGMSLAAATTLGATKHFGKDVAASGLRTLQRQLERVGSEAAQAERIPVPVSVSGARSAVEGMLSPAMADEDPSGYREASERFKNRGRR
jgi:hypothetical protein